MTEKYPIVSKSIKKENKLIRMRLIAKKIVQSKN